MDIKVEISRRASIAAHLFDWTPERRAGFDEELSRQVSIPNRVLDSIRPEDFGYDFKDFFEPGPEVDMPPALRAAIGRFDAACAFRSWDVVPDGQPDPASLQHLAQMFIHRVEMDHVDPEAISWHDEFPLTSLARHYDAEGGAAAWLRAEHQASIEDGRSGYTEMILERFYTPSVYVQHEGEDPEIVDGWHRTAGALVAGATTIQTILVPLMAKEPDMPSMS